MQIIWCLCMWRASSPLLELQTTLPTRDSYNFSSPIVAGKKNHHHRAATWCPKRRHHLIWLSATYRRSLRASFRKFRRRLDGMDDDRVRKRESAVASIALHNTVRGRNKNIEYWLSVNYLQAAVFAGKLWLTRRWWWALRWLWRWRRGRRGVSMVRTKKSTTRKDLISKKWRTCMVMVMMIVGVVCGV